MVHPLGEISVILMPEGRCVGCLFPRIVNSVQPQHGLMSACSQGVQMGTLHLVLICKILRINMLIKLNFVRTVSPNQAT